MFGFTAYNLPIVSLFALSILHQINPASAQQQKACYDTAGNQNAKLLPCKPNDSASFCCDLGWICLSNGLCGPGPNVKNNGLVEFYRPGCTDQTWKDPACFSGCNSFQGNGLKPCGGGNFCCYNMSGCDCAQTTISLGVANFLMTLPLTIPSSTPSSTPATTSAGAITTSQTSTPPSSGSVTTGTAAATQQQSNNSGTSSPPPSEPKKDNSVALGAGLGVGLGIPLLAALVGVVLLLNRRKSAANTAPLLAHYEMGTEDKVHPHAAAPAYSYAHHAEQPRHELPPQGIPHELPASHK
ncbi:hypothetical protein B0J11DRAFT_118814 [Dendryphion nanum]|uniref:Mid2 domain-containing protein n=1 Tax=Dendryphion nanum TaxID=256645 RepID=A0A9P9DBY6_9PLEO|nr:hypothetical protein B0J11DRAFT_118814 [Dendryphion nanum]